MKWPTYVVYLTKHLLFRGINILPTGFRSLKIMQYVAGHRMVDLPLQLAQAKVTTDLGKHYGPGATGLCMLQGTLPSAPPTHIRPQGRIANQMGRASMHTCSPHTGAWGF
jgi:hypothetical protein